ncbi:MAG: prevent-host-death protein [Gammaproteobacteria bacterium]|nr:prevent-host-death protein [Gammaproteobacteria bacterium]
MQQLSVRQMRESIGKLDRLVDEAGEIIVTRNGKAIARILPIKGSRQRPSHAELRQSLPRSNMSSATLIRADRDER